MSAAVSLRLPARPENVAVVRQALTGLVPVLPVHPARDAAMEAASTGHSSG